MNKADSELDAIRTKLTSTAGGYLRNLIIKKTCSVCFCPILGLGPCSKCVSNERRAPGVPDALGFMTYASHADPIEQSGSDHAGIQDRMVLLESAQDGQSACGLSIAQSPTLLWAGRRSRSHRMGDCAVLTAQAGCASLRYDSS